MKSNLLFVFSLLISLSSVAQLDSLLYYPNKLPKGVMETRFIGPRSEA